MITEGRTQEGMRLEPMRHINLKPFLEILEEEKKGERNKRRKRRRRGREEEEEISKMPKQIKREKEREKEGSVRYTERENTI